MSGLTKAAQDRIWIRDGGLCVYCGDWGEQIDHVIPLAHYGPSFDANLVVACRRCNNTKGGLLDVEFLTAAIYHLLTIGVDTDWFDEWQTV